MEKVILIFIDGVGIGADDRTRNPVIDLFKGIDSGIRLCEGSFPSEFPGGYGFPLDACLGVDGIPQSATGQSSLYTGVNAQAYLGYHLNAMPNDALIHLLCRESLPVHMKRNGIRSRNANLHSSAFFGQRRSGHRNRFPVSTIMTFAGKTSFVFEKEYRKGQGVYMDITGKLMRERGFDIPLITPLDAAERLCRMTGNEDFIYFEYFLTDRWGHKRNREILDSCLDDLIPFLGELSGLTRENNIHLLVCSDHGNAEDFDTGDHTRNPVPFLYIPSFCYPAEKRDALLKNPPEKITDVCNMVKNIYNIKIDNNIKIREKK